ncbi:hypothetical protein FJT64_011285 [Amphibalanus amphitrite]|uniref:COMM domain-containing protein n=1 Tax=Amphibalanus amphitrite TaxID=1232801 RepID=A0A6A4VA41_AMPAM|nr:hypothetical protein FJT64_011285 [Amphibalanus amphitrite]
MLLLQVLLNMELPKEHLEGLRLCTSLSDKSFKALIRRALLDGSDPSKREHVSSLQVKCRDTPADTLVRCHAAVLATFLEHVRFSGGTTETTSTARLQAVLQNAGWSPDRQAALVSLSAEAAPAARRLLSSLTHGPSRLVDLRWRELADVACSISGAAESSQEAQFEVTLVMEPPGGGRTEEVTMAASRHQLQNVLAELRQAGRALQSLSEGTATPPPPPPVPE